MSSFRPQYDQSDGIPAIEVVAGMPRKGLITLDEIRECLASIARELLAARGRAPAASAATTSPRPSPVPGLARAALASRIVSVLRPGVELSLDEVVAAVGLTPSLTAATRVRDVLNDCIRLGSVSRRKSDEKRRSSTGRRPFVYSLATTEGPP